MPHRRSPLVLRLFALALADGGSRNSSLHPPPEALGISTRRGPGRFFSFPRMLDRLRCFAQAKVIYFNSAAQGAHSAKRLSRNWHGGIQLRRHCAVVSRYALRRALHNYSLLLIHKNIASLRLCRREAIFLSIRVQKVFLI